MQVNVSAIREQKGALLPVVGETPCPPLEVEGGEVELCRPVRVRGSVTNTGKGYLLQAHLSTTVVLECTRCLGRFEFAVERDIEEMFYPERMRSPELEQNQPVTYFTDDVLELSEPLRENLQLALPMKRVCRPDCRGLCPVCGHNLNEGPCTCGRATSGDPRWEALEKLRGLSRPEGI